MPRFGIASPVLGLKTDVPSIALVEAYTPDNNNCQVVDGEIRRAKLPLLLFATAGDGTTAGTAVPVPERAYLVTGYDDTAGVYTVTVAGNWATEIATYGTLSIHGSTDNDGDYTIESATFDVDHTDIVVTEAITTGTDDGAVWLGTGSILAYHQLVEGQSGSTFLFVFTPHNILKWNNANRTYTVMHVVAASAGCTAWQAASFNDNVIATNNSDAPLRWLSSTPNVAFAVLTGTAGVVDKASFVTVFENMVFFGDITVGATRYPAKMAWSDIGDETKWATGSAGSATVRGDGNITGGFARQGDYLYVFKDLCIVKAWLVTAAEVISQSVHAHNDGCRCPGSIVSDGEGQVYYYGTSRKIKRLDGEEISNAVDRTVRLISPSLLAGVRSTYIREYGEIWWAVPGDSTATANSVILKYKEGLWNKADIAVAAFGEYRAQEDMDWIDLPYDNWTDWDWEDWVDPAQTIQYPLDLLADYSGQTFLAHGSSGTGDAHFVISTDFTAKEEVTGYKRWLRGQVYFRPPVVGFDVDIEVKRGGEENWQAVATVTIPATTSALAIVEFPCDFRAKTFDIRLSPPQDFSFLGLVCDWAPSGRW